MKRKFLLGVAAWLLGFSVLLSGCSAQGEGQSTSQGGGAQQSSSESGKENQDYSFTVERNDPDSPASFANFGAMDLNGERRTAEIFADADLTMVNIWATYCTICLDEMPLLAELAQENAEKGLQVIGVVTDVTDMSGEISSSQVELAKEIAEKTGADYPHLLLSEDLLQTEISQITGVPSTFFIDSQGEIVGSVILGGGSKEAWQAVIDERLAEVA